MVGDVQMSHRTEPQKPPEATADLAQELTGISGARIGDDKPMSRSSVRRRVAG